MIGPPLRWVYLMQKCTYVCIKMAEDRGVIWAFEAFEVVNIDAQ